MRFYLVVYGHDDAPENMAFEFFEDKLRAHMFFQARKAESSPHFPPKLKVIDIPEGTHKAQVFFALKYQVIR